MDDDFADSTFDVGDIGRVSVRCGESDDGFVAGRGSVLIIRSLSLSSVSLNPSLDSTQSRQFSGWLLVLARETLRGIMVICWHHSLSLFLLYKSY